MMEHEKENRSSNRRLKAKKILQESSEVQSKEEEKEKSKNAPVTALKPEVKSKPLGFWSKKLQDLEKSAKKNRQGELYDFTCTDDSENSNKRRKRPRQNRRMQKKRQPIRPKYKKPKEKTNKPLEKKTDRKPLLKNDNLINRDTAKLTDEHKSITCAVGLQATALTSTPAVNRDNVVNPSNFLFLSPITKVGTEYFSGINEYPPAKPSDANNDSVTKCSGQETPKIETKLRRISCRRVLRSGRMLTKL